MNTEILNLRKASSRGFGLVCAILYAFGEVSAKQFFSHTLSAVLLVYSLILRRSSLGSRYLDAAKPCQRFVLHQLFAGDVVGLLKAHFAAKILIICAISR